MRRLLGPLVLCLFASRAFAYTQIRKWTFGPSDWVGGGGEWYYNYHETGDESRGWGENSSGSPSLFDPPYAFCAEDWTGNAQDYPADYHCQMQFNNWYSLAGYASALVVFDSHLWTVRGRDKLSLWADRGAGWVKVFETSGQYGYRNWRVGLDGAGSGSNVRLRFRFDSENSWSGGAWVDSLTLYASSPLLNLRARDFTCDSQQALTDEVVRVTFTLENTSSVGVASVSYGIYLAWWGNEIDPLQDNLLLSGTVVGLGPGESTGVEKWVNVGLSAGSYEIGVYVDDALSLDEGNELDNSSATNINIFANDSYEKNDSFGTAKEFSTTMTTEWGLTLIDDDWYYTVVNPGETIAVVADCLWGDVVLELYDQFYNLLDRSDNLLDTKSLICTSMNGSGGSMDFYYRVYSPSGDWCWYDLTVKRDSATQGYAIVLGVDVCEFADEDAAAVASALLSDSVWTQVTLLTNSDVTQAKVDAALWNAIDNAGPCDRVLFYFSGLAGKPQYGASFMLYDGEEYPCNWLRELNKAGTKDLVLVFDADRAGSMVQDVRWGSFAQGLSATSHDGTAERPPQLGHGAFTYFFHEALTQAATDADEDGFITSEEAFVKARVNLALFSSQGAHIEDSFAEGLPLIEVRPSDHSLTVYQPTGTETWTSGTAHRIRWSDTGIGGKVDILFGRDFFPPSETIAVGVPNTGVYSWLLPGLDASNCRVLVRTDWGAVEGVSPGGFTILSEPLVQADLAIVDAWVENAGGDPKWVYATVVNTGPVDSAPVRVEFWRNTVLVLPPPAPDDWTDIGALRPGERTDVSFQVTGPGAPEVWTSYFWVDAWNVITEEHEDDNFWGPIHLGWWGETAPRIELTSPYGGKPLAGGISEQMTWWNEGPTGGWVMIEFSSDGGGNWITVAARAPNTGSFEWTPPQLYSEKCLVKVTALSTGCADASDYYFTVMRPGILGGGCGAGVGASALALLLALAFRRRR